jgi:exonuclease III
MAGYKAITDWLARRAHSGETVILAADLNTWTDPVELVHPDRSDGWFEESAFVGPKPRHRLIDAYRETLSASSLARLSRDRPDGPLETSYILSDGAEHRMDRIYISPDLTSTAAGYEFDKARSAGSDHALHWVDLTVR